MNYRLKELRNYLHLSQKNFGEKIGMKPNSISDLEKGKNKLTDVVIKSICREFNVNETWLRTGEGEMFVEVLPEDEFAKATGHLALDEDEALIRNIIVLYDKLDKPSRKVINDLIVEAVEKMKGGE